MSVVLITGGAGYIGSHCAKALRDLGHEPVTLDNLTTGHAAFARFGPLVRGDLRDADLLRRVMDDVCPVAVVHLAALSVVGESVAHPALYEDANVGGTRTLLSVMAERGPSKLVFSSTASVYGDVPAAPITESVAPAPTNPYGATKLACEALIAEACAAGRLSAIVFRYFNAAGADAAAGIGEKHDPETHLIPLVLDVAAGRRPSIDVLGDDYSTPDGTAIRDYVHVADIADAHGLGLRHLLGGGESLTLNLGTGTGASVLEVLAAAEAVTGRPIARRIAQRRPGDQAVLVADAGEARRRLGWTARRSDLPTIIADAWAWHGML